MSSATKRGSTEKYLDDAAITTKIKAKYLADDIISSFDIHVVTEDTKVTLSGNVPNPRVLNHAIKIAKNTIGVSEVIPKITVS